MSHSCLFYLFVWNEAVRKDLKSKSVATNDAKLTCLQENSVRCLQRNGFCMSAVFICFIIGKHNLKSIVLHLQKLIMKFRTQLVPTLSKKQKKIKCTNNALNLCGILYFYVVSQSFHEFLSLLVSSPCVIYSLQKPICRGSMPNITMNKQSHLFNGSGTLRFNTENTIKYQDVLFLGMSCMFLLLTISFFNRWLRKLDFIFQAEDMK